MLKQLQEIAMNAGRLFSEKRPSRIEQKEGHANYVTNIDREVEDYLQAALLDLVPGSGIIGEEKENEGLSDAPTWIVDPVDGTTNLIHDYRMSAVSIALCESKKPVLGLIWQPYTRELFFAEKGRGATLNGQPIHAAETPFERALVTIGTSPYHPALAEKSMRIALDCLLSCADIRRSGSAAIDLACVACGRLDAFFELNLKPWDYAAGSLLIQEAGGCFSMPSLSGPPCYDLSTTIAASSAVCADGFFSLLRSHLSNDSSPCRSTDQHAVP
ncbi:MAG: inositol monophosphatase [Clostridia bacterium]|nr:inositol monophosphatase [Clostridia bacterium]